MQTNYHYILKNKVFTLSSVNIQQYIDTLTQNAKEVGLFINVKKTKCMSTNKNKQPINLTVYGKPIEQVTEFIYLGHKLYSTNNGAVAVQHRIGLGWAAFQKHKHILTSDQVPYRIKNKVYNPYILPVVLDCVNWTNTLLSKIETFQNHIMRFITNNSLTDHIKIQTIIEKTGLIPMVKPSSYLAT